MSALAQRLQELATPDPEGLSRREQAMTAFFGTWAIAGLFLDGWAHEANKPETFFSPWHGVLYSAFAVAVSYSMIDGYRRRARGEVVRADPAILGGLVLFGVAGVGDMIWHQIFGIEVNVEALISPSHLLLLTAGLVLLGGSLRTAWRRSASNPSFREFFPTLVTYTLVVALIAFFTMYLSAFRVGELAPSSGEVNEVYGMATLFWTTVLFMGAALVLLSRWTVPIGSFTLLFSVVSLAVTGLRAFEQAPLALAGVIGGVTADILVKRRASARVFSAVVPATMWSTFFAIFQVLYGVGWSVELWSGAIALTALVGFGLSMLAFPPAQDRSATAVS